MSRLLSQISVALLNKILNLTARWKPWTKKGWPGQTCALTFHLGDVLSDLPFAAFAVQRDPQMHDLRKHLHLNLLRSQQVRRILTRNIVSQTCSFEAAGGDGGGLKTADSSFLAPWSEDVSAEVTGAAVPTLGNTSNASSSSKPREEPGGLLRPVGSLGLSLLVWKWDFVLVGAWDTELRAAFARRGSLRWGVWRSMALPVLPRTMDLRPTLVHIAADAGDAQRKLTPFISSKSKGVVLNKWILAWMYEREREKELNG